ncbi:conserved membrane protein, unknown function, partial [Hepatocystis sp. ex Piliocolobus tephrosceles]
MIFFLQFITIAILVTFLDKYEKIPVFYARKLTHMVCGVFILVFDFSLRKELSTLNSNDAVQKVATRHYYCLYIYLISLAAILRCFFYPFRFGKLRDKGIIIYNIIVSLFFLFNIPLYTLTPIFFADPMAAIVGIHFPKYTIYQKKT